MAVIVEAQFDGFNPTVLTRVVRDEFNAILATKLYLRCDVNTKCPADHVRMATDHEAVYDYA